MTHQSAIYPLRGILLLITILSLILISGCGAGDGQGLDENGSLLGTSTGGGPTDDGGPPGASGNPNATLAWVQDNVFGGVCTQCHTGAGAPLGVNWSTESDSCSNIGRSSGEITSMLEIDSGNPDGSYVVWKIEGQGPSGEPIVGGQMPLSNPPLTADAMQNIRDWISDGTPGCQVPKSAARTQSQPAGSDALAAYDSAAYPEGSWMYIWEQSLRLCSTCHSVTPSDPSCVAELECPPRGLVLSADNYYGLIDGVTVNPFDPANSNLWTRVTETNPDLRMPLGYPPLTQTQQDIIHDWILNAAPLRPAPD